MYDVESKTADAAWEAYLAAETERITEGDASQRDATSEAEASG